MNGASRFLIRSPVFKKKVFWVEDSENTMLRKYQLEAVLL